MILWHFSNYNVTNHYHVFLKKKTNFSHHVTREWRLWNLSPITGLDESERWRAGTQRFVKVWAELVFDGEALHVACTCHHILSKGQRWKAQTGDLHWWRDFKNVWPEHVKKKKIQFNIVSLSSHFNDKMIIFFVYSFNHYFWRHGCKTFFFFLQN